MTGFHDGRAIRPEADWLRTACLMELAADKPGNVGLHHSFTDLTAADFRHSADALFQVTAETVPSTRTGAGCTVGDWILTAVRATQDAVGTNTNLGIVLLSAPLLAVPREVSLAAGIGAVLEALTVWDAEQCYAGIRLAKPGGLGDAPDQSVAETPTVTLTECMRLAAWRDRIAAQYTNNYADVLGLGRSLWCAAADVEATAPGRIRRLAVGLLATLGDSLIARKCGDSVSVEAGRKARVIFDSRQPCDLLTNSAYREFDQWLRADGHRRNPGTTADLVAATLYAGLRDGWVEDDGEWYHEPPPAGGRT